MIILLGGKTGRDGVGGATGSSKVQTVESVETAGAEVQKGMPSKSARFNAFSVMAMLLVSSRNPTTLVLVVSVWPSVNWQTVLKLISTRFHLKYQGLNGTEIAISESQERMAVVVRPEDVDAFVAECNKENIDAVVVATVTEKPNLVMHWNGETIVDLERRFLDTNGVRVVVDAKVVDKDVKLPEERHNNH